MNDKIIADFLEINRDISMIGIGKKFKFINNIKKKYYRKKLIKRVEILAKSDIILTKNNIFELVSYIYSNYLPTGKFGYIDKIDYFSKINMFKVFIIEKENNYIISISEKDKKLSLCIITKNDINNKSYTIELKELSSNNREVKKYIDDLNKILLNTMIEYIMDIIKSYDGKENEI